jgi:hypothetical protein
MPIESMTVGGCAFPENMHLKVGGAQCAVEQHQVVRVQARGTVQGPAREGLVEVACGRWMHFCAWGMEPVG